MCYNIWLGSKRKKKCIRDMYGNEDGDEEHKKVYCIPACSVDAENNCPDSKSTGSSKTQDNVACILHDRCRKWQKDSVE